MSATEDRIVQLAQQFLDLERELNLDANFADAGVSSVDALAFIKTVSREFDVEIPPEDLENIPNLRSFIEYVEAKSG